MIFGPETSTRGCEICIVSGDRLTFLESPSDSTNEPSESFVKVNVKHSGNGFEAKSSLLRVKRQLHFEKQADFANFCLMRDNVLVCSSSSPEPHLTFFDVSGETVQLSKTIAVEKPVRSITTDRLGGTLAVQLEGENSISRFDYGDDVLSPWTTGDGSIVGARDAFVHTSLVKTKGAEMALVGLTSRNRLYVDSREVCSNASSFFVHSHFLLVTTLSHTLLCLPLDKLSSAVDKLIWSEEYVRGLERGAKLVVAVARESKVVLQMPRGNLETIHPRPLVIHMVKGYLDAKKYSLALDVLRRHRIDLNLIVDHDPEAFMDSVEDFAGQIVDDHRLCLFIAELR